MTVFGSTDSAVSGGKSFPGTILGIVAAILACCIMAILAVVRNRKVHKAHFELEEYSVGSVESGGSQ